jgi:hypothetical protein
MERRSEAKAETCSDAAEPSEDKKSGNSLRRFHGLKMALPGVGEPAPARKDGKSETGEERQH